MQQLPWASHNGFSYGKAPFRHFLSKNILFFWEWIFVLSMEQSILTNPSANQKIPPFYGTRRFIIAFTKARHLSLSWASWIQSTPFLLIPLRSILIFSFRPCLALLSGILQVYPKKTCMHYLLHHTCHTHLLSHSFLFYRPNIFGVQLLIMQSVTSSAPYLRPLSLCYYPTSSYP